MTPAQLALASIRSTLQEIARTGDGERLRRLLRGRELPALGSGEEPAIQITQALEFYPYDAELTRHIGHLCTDLTKLWLERLEALNEQETTWSAIAHPIRETPPVTTPGLDDEPYIYNLLLLVSWLPRDTRLFEVLYPYHTSEIVPSVLAAGFGRSARQLRRALCNQQTDTRLKDYWLSLLKKPDTDSPWDNVRRSELLEAWRGVLWLPRPSEQGPPLDLEAMDAGLHLLADTVARHDEEHDEIMRDALQYMVDAIPLDPATWVELIAPFRSGWPELLRDLAAEIWPDPEPRSLADLPRLPADLAALWKAFAEDTRSVIREALNSSDPEAGQQLVNDLVFSPPHMTGLPPQEIRRRIIELGHVLWPVSETQPSVEGLYDDRDWQEEPERTKGRARGVDRLAALEAVNRGLATVEQCLQQGNETRARSYLDELVDNQSAQGLPDTDIHVAKTLSRAAVLARDAGLLEWAEQLQRKACRRNDQDPVAANGLAEVLKARGDLDAAEQQYRANMERWPNNEVAASGLAEVLKARGELDAAEQQYRANIARWPNNEVAASGLAEVLKARGELDAAEQQYRANIERWPNDEVAANGLADVLKARGELDAAEQQYRANIERWPNNEVARHGLANVLRKRRRHADALQLLPNPLQPVTAQDLYDLHLRGMILLELGRWDEALDAFERGLAAARVPVHRAVFRRGLVLMELSRRNPEAAQRRLRDLPEDVPQLNIYRLHAAAGRRDEAEARALRTRLNADIVRMDFTARTAFRKLEAAYCLGGPAGICEPDEAAYRAVIDAEIEMEQAA